MNAPKAVSLVLLVCAGVALHSQGAIGIVNETWLDGTRTDPVDFSEYGVDVDLDGNIESSWFSSNPAGAAVSAGHYVQATVSGSTSWQTYYTPEATPITLINLGDSMKLTWVFTPSGVANDAAGNTGQNFRLAVVDSPSANRLTTDVAPGAPSGGNYNGYAMFMNMDQTLRRSTPFELRERGSGTAAFLGTSADWIALGDNGGTGDPGYASGTQYTYTFTLTRNALNGLDVVSRMEGTGLGPGGQGFLEVNLTDATPSSFSYDMFGIRPSGSATSATSFDTTSFQVEFTQAPEPGTLTLLLVGAGMAGAFYRNRRKN